MSLTKTELRHIDLTWNEIGSITLSPGLFYHLAFEHGFYKGKASVDGCSFRLLASDKRSDQEAKDSAIRLMAKHRSLE